jgi:hypothetical protein
MDKREVTPRQMPPGEIHPNVLYRADEVKARMGWTDSAFRAARRRGLTVRRDGKRAYLLGDDVIDYLKGRTSDPASPFNNPTCANR